MKRKGLILGVMLSCLLGLSACGSAEADTSAVNPKFSFYSDGAFSSLATTYEDDRFEVWYANGVTPENFDSMLYGRLAVDINIAYALDGQTDSSSIVTDDDTFNVLKAGYTSWYNALDEIGYGSSASLADDIKVTDVEYSFNDEDQLVVDATIQGTKHSALLEMYFDNTLTATDIGVTVNKTTAEKLENAGLNTLLGMGMAFAILILISLIISLFPLFIGGSKKKKKESDKEITKKAMENTISQIEEQEDLSEDAELVAVIAAAIAAYEGSAGTDGFQVRSIRKVNKNWKR